MYQHEQEGGAAKKGQELESVREITHRDLYKCMRSYSSNVTNLFLEELHGLNLHLGFPSLHEMCICETMHNDSFESKFEPSKPQG